MCIYSVTLIHSMPQSCAVVPLVVFPASKQLIPPEQNQGNSLPEHQYKDTQWAFGQAASKELVRIQV